MELSIGIAVFILTLLLIYAGYFCMNKIFKPEQKKAHQRLKGLSMSGNRTVDIVKKRTFSEIPRLNDLLLKASFASRLERLHDQANPGRPIGVFLILSALLFAGGLCTALAARLSLVAMLPLSLLLSAVPFLYLGQRRKKRMRKFERQLPEALDLIARALKAGHAFSGGMRLVAEEFGDPLGTEFGKTVDEINFGISVPDALMNLAKRVDCEDLRFFVVSVIVQRETGGNLSEILENLGRLIRERFKFQGRVRILSAEGRMSAAVLLALPFFLAGLFSLFNPDYIAVLFSDSIGTVLITASLTLMSLGAVIIKNLVAIKA